MQRSRWRRREKRLARMRPGPRTRLWEARLDDEYEAAGLPIPRRRDVSPWTVLAEAAYRDAVDRHGHWYDRLIASSTEEPRKEHAAPA